MSFTLSLLQERAVKAVSQWWKSDIAQTFYMAGYAGSGKTSMMPQLIGATGISPENVAFVAPTAKAAMVMTQKLRAMGIDRVAKTIHHFMYIPKSTNSEQLKGQILDLRKQDQTKEIKTLIKKLQETIYALDTSYKQDIGFLLKPGFYSATCPEPMLIILDEASMVGSKMGRDLESFRIPIIAIGDPAQLKPVRDTSFLTQGTPDFFLDEIHRQAEGSAILHLASLAREGKRLPLGNFGDGVQVVKKRNDESTLADRDLQVLCGRNRTRWKLTEKIRNMLGYEDSGPYKDEPLICVQNSYAMPEFVNGLPLMCLQDVGDLEKGNASFTVGVETPDGQKRWIPAFQPILEEQLMLTKDYCSCEIREAKNVVAKSIHLDFSWVITTHKSQGSQWDEVVLHDESRFWRGEEKNWLYTGITRAAERLTVVVPNNY